MLRRREFLLSPLLAAAAADRPIHAQMVVEPGHPLAAESARGYARHLEARVDAPLIIVPGFRSLESPHEFRTRVEHGATLILESGLAFGSESDMSRQHRLLADVFNLQISRSLSHPVRSEFRYIRYHWPSSVLVREFSESVTIESAGVEPIATAEGSVVAVQGRMGRGRLVYLGSMLGPMLWAGDPQAEKWLQSIATI